MGVLRFRSARAVSPIYVEKENQQTGVVNRKPRQKLIISNKPEQKVQKGNRLVTITTVLFFCK